MANQILTDTPADTIPLQVEFATLPTGTPYTFSAHSPVEVDTMRGQEEPKGISQVQLVAEAAFSKGYNFSQGQEVAA